MPNWLTESAADAGGVPVHPATVTMITVRLTVIDRQLLEWIAGSAGHAGLNQNGKVLRILRKTAGMREMMAVARHEFDERVQSATVVMDRLLV